MIGANWRTSLAGVSVALGTVAAVGSQIANGTFQLDATTIGMLWAAASAVIGLFKAKDAVVTGGTVKQ